MPFARTMPSVARVRFAASDVVPSSASLEFRGALPVSGTCDQQSCALANRANDKLNSFRDRNNLHTRITRSNTQCALYRNKSTGAQNHCDANHALATGVLASVACAIRPTA